LLTAPREFHPSEVLSEPPPLRDPKQVRAVAGREYLPIAYHRRTEGNPVVIAGSFSLVGVG